MLLVVDDADMALGSVLYSLFWAYILMILFINEYFNDISY